MEKETLARMFGDIFSTCTDLSEEVLAQYAELVIAGQEAGRQLPGVGAHLDECPDCAGRYAELLALLQAEVGGQVPATPRPYLFSLQFLPGPMTDLWVEVKDTVYRLAAGIPIVVQRAMAGFGTLPTVLSPCRVAVATGAARSAVEISAGIESLRIPDESANLAFIFTPGPADVDKEGATLVLKVEELQSGEPLGHVRVHLRDSQDQLLQSKMTMADGRAVFHAWAGDYIVRCKHAGRTWDFPVRLTPGLSVDN